MQNILTILLLASIIIDVWLIVFTATRPDRKRVSSFTILCCILLIYNLGYMGEIHANTPQEAFIALIVENFAIANIPILYLLTSISFFAPKRYKKQYLYYAMCYGILHFTVVLTNNYHHQYYTSIDMISNGAEYFLRLSKGPVFYVHQGLTVVCLVIAYTMMLMRFFRGSKKLRRQMLFFIIGSLISFIANILNVSGVLPPGLDPVPLALTVSLVLFSISLVRDDLMDVVVRARDTAVETMDKAFLVLDDDCDFLYCNQSAIGLFPELSEFEGTESICTVERWPDELKNLNKKEQVDFTLDFDGTKRYYRAEVNRIYRRASISIGFSILISDITDETLLIERLETMATTDPLTGILNRRRLFEMIERELEIAKRFEKTTALIMFDLDHFKRVNDDYGHHVGDLVLKQTATSIASSLRVYDIFGRLGGEEFIVFTQSPGTVGLVNFANRLRQLIEAQSIETGRETIHYTASFGIAEIQPGEGLKEALSRVDQAMYYAKESGRNRVALDSKVLAPAENIG